MCAAAGQTCLVVPAGDAGVSPCRYTNAAQDEIHRRYHHGTALHMMCWMNFWCGECRQAAEPFNRVNEGGTVNEGWGVPGQCGSRKNTAGAVSSGRPSVHYKSVDLLNNAWRAVLRH